MKQSRERRWKRKAEENITSEWKEVEEWKLVWDAGSGDNRLAGISNEPGREWKLLDRRTRTPGESDGRGRECSEKEKETKKKRLVGRSDRGEKGRIN